MSQFHFTVPREWHVVATKRLHTCGTHMAFPRGPHDNSTWNPRVCCDEKQTGFWPQVQVWLFSV